MKIIVLRHATRKRDDPVRDEYLEKHLPLDPIGEEETRQLGLELARRGIKPAIYFTSCFAHARQTAEILRDIVNGSSTAKVVELCTLTPHYQGPRELRQKGEKWQGLQMLGDIIRESESMISDLRELEVLAFILHWPRLEQLLASMTSKDESCFYNVGYSEGICLKAESLDDLLQGKAEKDGPRFGRQ
jgi:phosphohistidine phosphatase SixA